MIELAPASVLMFYLALTTLAILSFWGWRHWQTRHHSLRLDSEELCICEFCHCVYLAQRTSPLNRCPQCQSLNRANRYRGS